MGPTDDIQLDAPSPPPPSYFESLQFRYYVASMFQTFEIQSI
jgi:hypothetical protein